MKFNEFFSKRVLEKKRLAYDIFMNTNAPFVSTTPLGIKFGKNFASIIILTVYFLLKKITVTLFCLILQNLKISASR